MTKNLLAVGLRRWLVSICLGWMAFAFLGLIWPMDAQAQSSDSGTPVLRFKIPSPPQQAASTSTTTTTLPSETVKPPAGTAPVIEEKPSEVPAEKQTSQQPAASPPSSLPAPAPLSHEILTPQKTAGPQPSVETPPQPAAPHAQPSPSPSPEKRPAMTQPEKKTPVSGSAVDKILSAISVQKDDPAGEILNVMLNGFYPPQVSSAEGGPPRIICDFPDVRLGQGVPKVIPVNGKFITQVRIGLHTKPALKVRIVLDLVPDYNYDVEQFYYQKENQYSLIVKKRS